MKLGRAEKLIRASLQTSGRRGPNSNGEYSVCCPFCQVKTGEPDTKFKLQLNAEKNLYNCYRCNSGGKAQVAALLEVDPSESVDSPQPAAELEPMPEEARPLDRHALSHAPYVEYLKKRALLGPAQGAGVLVCDTGYYRGRVLIPHKLYSATSGYRYAGFVARAIHDYMMPKYLYPRGMDRRGTVWAATVQWTADVVVVEGVFDALAVGREAVATFGKNVTHEQLDILEGYRSRGSRIIICLDGDAWEECAALAMRCTLRGMADTKWCRLPPGTDPGVLGKDAYKYIVR